MMTRAVSTGQVKIWHQKRSREDGCITATNDYVAMKTGVEQDAVLAHIVTAFPLPTSCLPSFLHCSSQRPRAQINKTTKVGMGLSTSDH